MIGREKKFICKNCEKEQIEIIGTTLMYKINNNKGIYIPIYCCHCETLNYVADEVTVIDEDTDEAKEIAYKKATNIIGNTEYAKDWYYKHTIFITKDKGILLQKDVKIIKDVGFQLN